MHLLGDLQRRPRKGRTSLEKAFKAINSLILLVQFTSLLVTATYASIFSTKTFNHHMWYPGRIELSAMLQYKLFNCTQNITYSFDAVGDFDMPLNSDTALDLLSYHSFYTALAVFFTLLAVASGAINKVLFDMNFYSFRYRNMVFRKSMLTTLELTFIALGLISASASVNGAPLLKDYFKFCGVRSKRLLPYASPLTGIFVSHAVVLFGHFVTLCLLIRTAWEKPPKNPEFYPVDFMITNLEGEVIFSPSNDDMEAMLSRNPDRRKNTAANRDAFERELPDCLSPSKKDKDTARRLAIGPSAPTIQQPPLQILGGGGGAPPVGFTTTTTLHTLPARNPNTNIFPARSSRGGRLGSFTNPGNNYRSQEDDRLAGVPTGGGGGPPTRVDSVVQRWQHEMQEELQHQGPQHLPRVLGAGGGIIANATSTPIEQPLPRFVQTQNSFYGGDFHNMTGRFATPGSSVPRNRSPHNSSQSVRDEIAERRRRERMMTGLFE